MSTNCEDQEICLNPLDNTKKMETKSTCTECLCSKKESDDFENKESIVDDCEDCNGCEDCQTDEDNSDDELEDESDTDSVASDADDTKEERIIKHMFKYFLATNDVLENRVSLSNTIMFAAVAPLYIAVAFLFGSMYGSK